VTWLGNVYSGIVASWLHDLDIAVSSSACTVYAPYECITLTTCSQKNVTATFGHGSYSTYSTITQHDICSHHKHSHLRFRYAGESTPRVTDFDP
jgi:hypothetical protein